MGRGLFDCLQCSPGVTYPRPDADRLSRAPSSPCRQCTRPDCPPVVSLPDITDQPFDSESTGSSEDADLIPIHSGEDWVAQFDDDLSQQTAIAGDSFRISTSNGRILTALHYTHGFRRVSSPPPCTEVKGLHPELRSLWHHPHWMTTELFGGSEVHRVLYCNCSSLNPGTALLGVPCLFVWRPFGQEPDIGTLGSSVLLVGHVG